VPVLTARDGQEALELIEAETARPGPKRPIVIVTDINMPGLSGHDLIDHLRRDPRHANSVIFVLTSSDLPSDLERAYKNQVAGYMIKDTTGATIKRSISMLAQYCDVVSIP
jgi:hypothetical protein